jgi:putative transposase
MDTCQSVGHTIWDCKYPVVFIPMCKRKALHVELRRYLGEVFRNLGA